MQRAATISIYFSPFVCRLATGLLSPVLCGVLCNCNDRTYRFIKPASLKAKFIGFLNLIKIKLVKTLKITTRLFNFLFSSVFILAISGSRKRYFERFYFIFIDRFKSPKFRL